MLSISDIESLHRHWRFLVLDYNEEFEDTYKMIHQAVQFLAITNKSILPPRFDDSHTSFSWNYRKNCFASEWIHAKRTFRIEFYPFTLCLSLVHYGEEPTESMYLIGKTKKEVYSQLRQMLGLGGVVVHHFATDMHYDLPEHRVCKGGKYQVISDHLNDEIVKHYSNAHLVLNMLRGKNPAATSIRCWPHHFDITADFPIGIPTEDNPSYISVGFSPANSDFPEPHFYFILRPDNTKRGFIQVKLKHGKWLPRNIKGTALGLSKITEKKSSQGQAEVLFWFINESYHTMQDQLMVADKEFESAKH